MNFLFSLLVLLLFSTQAYSHSLNDSSQLVLVTTTQASAIQGHLQRYERSDLHHAWQAVGPSWAIVVGQKGMTTAKQEGDLRTPIGVYDLGTSFGFASKAFNKRLPYLALHASSVCVDDPQSIYYNQILDAKAVKAQWQSAEALATIPLYQWGLVIRYNQPNPQAGKGSCLFIHRWRQEGKGTAGCVAMDEANLHTLLQWLEENKKPQLALMTGKEVVEFKKRWGLH